MPHCQHVPGTTVPSKSGLSEPRTAFTNTSGVRKEPRESCPARYRQDPFCCLGGGGFEQDTRCPRATAAVKTGRGRDREHITHARASPWECRCPPLASMTLTPGPGGEASICSGAGGSAEREERDAGAEPSPQAPPQPVRPLQPPTSPFMFWG